jgi:hypothetical protein
MGQTGGCKRGPSIYQPGEEVRLKSRLQGRSPCWRQGWRPGDAGRPNSARSLPMGKKSAGQFRVGTKRVGEGSCGKAANCTTTLRL